jgi:hypothetical protein
VLSDKDISILQEHIRSKNTLQFSIHLSKKLFKDFGLTEHNGMACDEFSKKITKSFAESMQEELIKKDTNGLKRIIVAYYNLLGEVVQRAHLNE